MHIFDISDYLFFSSYTAIYLPLRKLSKFDGPDMQGTAGEAGTSS